MSIIILFYNLFVVLRFINIYLKKKELFTTVIFVFKYLVHSRWSYLQLKYLATPLTCVSKHHNQRDGCLLLSFILRDKSSPLKC